jgi:mono/diheme cytochrome c family protein
MLGRSLLFFLFVLFANFADAEQQMRDATRGELLYSTHCIACHNVQVHWRKKKLATDWTTLRSQVHRWQEVSGLGWDADDIVQVAQYLNSLYYHYPLPD